MYGAILGDIIGSTHEFAGIKTKNFPLFPGGSDFTDDSILTMDRTLDQIRENYKFEGTCQFSVPESIIAFLESTNFEDAICNTISLGGDADTMGAITGSIAWSFYRFQSKTGISARMAKLWIKAVDYLPDEWIDFIPRFDKLCREREEQYQKSGHVEPFLLA